MSLEQRLRDSLRRSSSIVNPDVGENLQVVRRKTKRLAIKQRVGQATVALAAIVGLVLVTPRIVDFARSFQPVQPASPGPIVRTGPPFLQIAGTYTTSVPASSKVVRDDGLAGRWTMRLQPNGVARLSGPPSFIGVLSGASYQISGTQFVIDLFAQDLCTGDPPGTYEWRRSGDRMTFTTLNDSCAARVALLASQPWSASK